MDMCLDRTASRCRSTLSSVSYIIAQLPVIRLRLSQIYLLSRAYVIAGLHNVFARFVPKTAAAFHCHNTNQERLCGGLGRNRSAASK